MSAPDYALNTTLRFLLRKGRLHMSQAFLVGAIAADASQWDRVLSIQQRHFKLLPPRP